MKIKGKFKKVNPMIPLYVLVGLLVVAIPLRTYQLLFNTESDTGFYKNIDWSVYVIAALSVIAVIVPYVVMYLAKSVPSSRKPPFRKNRFLAASAVLFGLGMLTDVLTVVFTLFFKKEDMVSVTNQFVIAEDLLPMIMQLIFGFCSVIYIMVFGISYIDGRTTYSQYKFLALAPLGWTIGRIVIRFLRRISYVNIADLMLEILALAFMMIFFLALARISSGLSNERSMRSLFASGYAGVFFTLTTNVPRFIITVVGSGELLPDEYPMELCDLFFAVFAISYIVNAMLYAKDNDHNELTESE